jgi:hypothetical protein
VVMRLYESSGLPTDVAIRGHWPFVEAELVDLLEESSGPAEVLDGAIRLSLEPFQIATVRARLQAVPRSEGQPAELGARAEPAQPVFADYWMHNKGTAPIGYQPVIVQIRPSRLEVGGPFKVPITVASERTDITVDGTVAIEVPPGWRAAPSEHPYRLGPGEHLAFDAEVSPPEDAPDGRYFVSARIDDGGQTHEDVVTLDLRTGSDGPATDTTSRSTSLGLAIERALVTAGLEEGRVAMSARPEDPLGGELLVDLLDRAITVAPGRRAPLRLSLRNCVASEIRGEAQVISPYDTWGFLDPWSQGFAVPAGKETVLEYRVAPPAGTPPGSWWALAKVMYFGRLIYTESIRVEVEAS